MRRRLCSFTNPSVALPTSQLILIIQSIRRFIYIIDHYQTLPLLHLRNSSFSNPSVTSPTSHALHLRHMYFTYVTCTSPTSPGEPPMCQTPLEPNSRYTSGYLVSRATCFLRPLYCTTSVSLNKHVSYS